MAWTTTIAVREWRICGRGVGARARSVADGINELRVFGAVYHQSEIPEPLSGSFLRQRGQERPRGCRTDTRDGEAKPSSVPGLAARRCVDAKSGTAHGGSSESGGSMHGIDESVDELVERLLPAGVALREPVGYGMGV